MTRRWRHKKRGTTYTDLGSAMIQSDVPLTDMDEVVIYRSEHDGSLWARRRSEFHDGRFERLDAAPVPPSTPDDDALVERLWKAVLKRWKQAQEKSGEPAPQMEWAELAIRAILPHLRAPARGYTVQWKTLSDHAESAHVGGRWVGQILDGDHGCEWTCIFDQRGRA